MKIKNSKILKIILVLSLSLGVYICTGISNTCQMFPTVTRVAPMVDPFFEKHALESNVVEEAYKDFLYITGQEYSTVHKDAFEMGLYETSFTEFSAYVNHDLESIYIPDEFNGRELSVHDLLDQIRASVYAVCNRLEQKVNVNSKESEDYALAGFPFICVPGKDLWSVSDYIQNRLNSCPFRSKQISKLDTPRSSCATYTTTKLESIQKKTKDIEGIFREFNSTLSTELNKVRYLKQPTPTGDAQIETLLNDSTKEFDYNSGMNPFEQKDCNLPEFKLVLTHKLIDEKTLNNMRAMGNTFFKYIRRSLDNFLDIVLARCQYAPVEMGILGMSIHNHKINDTGKFIKESLDTYQISLEEVDSCVISYVNVVSQVLDLLKLIEEVINHGIMTYLPINDKEHLEAFLWREETIVLNSFYNAVLRLDEYDYMDIQPDLVNLIRKDITFGMSSLIYLLDFIEQANIWRGEVLVSDISALLKDSEGQKLSQHEFTSEDLEVAQDLQQFIITHEIIQRYVDEKILTRSKDIRKERRLNRCAAQYPTAETEKKALNKVIDILYDSSNKIPIMSRVYSLEILDKIKEKKSSRWMKNSMETDLCSKSTLEKEKETITTTTETITSTEETTTETTTSNTEETATEEATTIPAINSIETVAVEYATTEQTILDTFKELDVENNETTLETEENIANKEQAHKEQVLNQLSIVLEKSLDELQGLSGNNSDLEIQITKLIQSLRAHKILEQKKSEESNNYLEENTTGDYTTTNSALLKQTENFQGSGNGLVDLEDGSDDISSEEPPASTEQVSDLRNFKPADDEETVNIAGRNDTNSDIFLSTSNSLIGNDKQDNETDCPVIAEEKTSKVKLLKTNPKDEEENQHGNPSNNSQNITEAVNSTSTNSTEEEKKMKEASDKKKHQLEALVHL